MFRTLSLLLSLILFTPALHAAEVLKVKGKSVLIDLKGDPAVTGDSFFALTPDGKRRGLIKISKVKGEKAIGKITKGKVEKGMILEFKPSKGGGGSNVARSAPEPDSSASEDSGGYKRSYWGALFGYGMDKMDVNVTDVNGNSLGTVNMSGTGFSAKALFDYELFPQIWFRGTSGLEQFNAEGGTICGVASNEACNAKLMYLTFDLIGRYVFGKGGFRPWIGGGLGLLFPVTKDASAIDSASISTTNVMVVAGGFDWFTSPTFFIPVSVEYGLLPKSDEVEASWMAIRFGFAVPF